MNWQTFQINNQSQEKAFECLCNQLFENWCQETYLSAISYFRNKFTLFSITFFI